MAMKSEIIYALGYSTRTISDFMKILDAHSIKLVADVRKIPKSGYNPQFNETSLKRSLQRHDIKYYHLPGLGGLRKTVKDSMNLGWRNASFRGYADYMQTTTFVKELDHLIALGKKQKTTIMCAEGNPFRCHRLLIADALLLRGITVFHISSMTSAKEHTLTAFAKVVGMQIQYPG
jgi:uncharacterized protein (DUF488 family)